jgi:NADH dehydrogenase FAD-containing subunit
LSSPHIGNVLHLRPTRNGVDPQVVIVGAGFGGLTAARALKRATVDITLVDRRLLSGVIGVGMETADMLMHEVLSRNPRDRKAVAPLCLSHRIAG